MIRGGLRGVKEWAGIKRYLKTAIMGVVRKGSILKPTVSIALAFQVNPNNRIQSPI
jgi:hypothetical protein